MRTLFITRDGPGLSYLESLFVPIFARLGALGFPFDVLQFRWGSVQERQRAEAACRDAAIGYRAVPIWRRPGGLGPMASALYGQRHVRLAVTTFGSQALMPRGPLAALSVPAPLRRTTTPMVYDADGLEIDERVDFAGLSHAGPAYRIMRDLEALAARDAQWVLVRTPAAREIMLARAGGPARPDRFRVVTNGRDEAAFNPGSAEQRAAVRARLGIAPAAPVVAYVGTIGYRHRTDQVGAFACELRRLAPETRLLVLSGSPDEAKAALVDANPALAGWTTILRARPEEVPALLAIADVGTAFVHPTFSTQGVAPLKTAEYLLCGVPVVGTAQVGRNGAALAAGVFHDEGEGLEAAARWTVEHVLPRREQVRELSRKIGVGEFSLARAVTDYLQPLTSLRDQLAARGSGEVLPGR